MELAINEVKTQAKKLLKAVQADNTLHEQVKRIVNKISDSSFNEIKLKHCLAYVSKQLGFDNWHHAQEVLSGKAKPTHVMGSFFYPKGADAFINLWFADYQQAKDSLALQPLSRWILPYKKQFIVVEQSYIEVFSLNEKSAALWADVHHDMVASYNSVAWDKLTAQIIKNRSKDY